MSGLYAALIGPFEAFAFMRLALVASLALALASGPVGTFLLLRRMSLDGSVLSHAVMPGAAAGFFLAGYSLAAMSLGGLASGLGVAALASLAGRRETRRSEAGLIAFYLFSLAAGVLIVSFRAGNADLMNVLFGTILAVDFKAMTLIALASSVTLIVMATIYRPLCVDTFDPAFLRSAGGGRIVGAVFTVLLAVMLVCSFQAFGTLLAIGPLLLPATAARLWARRAPQIIVLAIVFGLVADYGGLLLSYHYRLPSGPAIVLCGCGLYTLSLLASALRAGFSANPEG